MTEYSPAKTGKTVSLEEQIMEKKTNIQAYIHPQMEAIVFIILQISFTTHTVLKSTKGIYKQ